MQVFSQLAQERNSLDSAIDRIFSGVTNLYRDADPQGHDLNVSMLRALIHDRFDAIYEYRRNKLTKDVSDILSFFTARSEQVKDITYLESDFHDGHRVLLCETTNGDRYTCKRCNPHSYNICNRWYGSFVGFSLNVYSIADTANSNDQIIFRNYYDSSPFSKDLAKTFYNFGSLLGFAYVFNITDLHCENVLITDSIPIPIDLECIFYPYDNKTMAFDVECTGVVERIRNRRGQISLTSLFGGGHLVEFNDPWVDSGGIVRFRKKKDVFQNVLLEEKVGRRVNVHDYKKDFLIGLNDYLEFVLKEKESIIDNLLSVENMQIRKIFTPTLLYRILLSESISLDHKQALRLFRSRLHNLRKNRVPDFVFSHEIASLAKGDIPAFHVEWQNGIFTFPSSRQKFGLPFSPVSIALYKLKRFNQSHIVRIIRVVKSLLDEYSPESEYLGPSIV